MTGEAPLRDEPAEVEVTDSDLVYRGRVWDIRSDTFRYGDGTLVRQYVDHPGAASIVALDESGRVLLIQQYRHPIRSRDWEVPAGLLDVAGEEPLHTAQRELAEEADLVARNWQPLLTLEPTPGGSNEVVHVFLARELEPAEEAHAREAEEADIRVQWVDLGEAITAVLEGRFRNGILAAGLFAAAELIRREGS